MSNQDALVVGAGPAGIVMAERLAGKDYSVTLIDRRSRYGGGAYDEYDAHGILIHPYGPHIFHTNKKHVFDYLSRFTKWNDYAHKVVANVYGKLIPVPFNLKALESTFGEVAGEIHDAVISVYGRDAVVTIDVLMRSDVPRLRELGQFVFENIFSCYTQKQWGIPFCEIDESVLKRVPVRVSYDDRYFPDTWQGLPVDGYSKMFAKMLDFPNIHLHPGVDSAQILELSEGGRILVDDQIFKGPVIYTGAIDELFQYRFGHLPYRTIDFCFETHNQNRYQTHGVVNYTVDEKFTRITEFKHMTLQKLEGCTTICKEYPRSYDPLKDELPLYPIATKDSNAIYQRYLKLATNWKNLWLIGRLAEFTYYNMDEIVDRALQLAKTIEDVE
ncbi:MAG: UDP-galactopyranose mutase [Clostridiales Family XIII bacterium]|jgi:UDP-galactopyranose mutase|nr:UDP-galactopyranose mutase [Clostridiales Family XIII bacterium]